MRTLLLFVLFWCLVFLFSSGCGSISSQTARGVWVEDGIPIELALRACSTWEPVGVECVEAESRDLALVVVSDSHEIGCEPAGGVVWAGSGGRGISPGFRDSSIPQNGWVHIHMGCWPDLSYLTDPNFLPEMAHEFGHAFGCSHVERGDALMFAGGGPMRLTTEDVNEYWRVN